MKESVCWGKHHPPPGLKGTGASPQGHAQQVGSPLETLVTGSPDLLPAPLCSEPDHAYTQESRGWSRRGALQGRVHARGLWAGRGPTGGIAACVRLRAGHLCEDTPVAPAAPEQAGCICVEHLALGGHP